MAPLDEACNYGNDKIVELLIKHGADVNDRGGELCDGATALHIAASYGHIHVMATLLNSGADSLAQTNAGKSVYDILVEWRNGASGDLDSRTLKDRKDMEQRLAESMEKGTSIIK